MDKIDKIDISYLGKEDLEEQLITKDGEKIHRLDMPIPPEIKKGDGFYEDLRDLVSKNEVENIIEIGSSCGDGSTKAIFEGMRNNPVDVKLFCIESSIGRYNILQNKYGYEKFIGECSRLKNIAVHYTLNSIYCYNVCSIPISNYMTTDDVTCFYINYPTNTNQYSLDQILGWLKEELNYIKDNHIPDAGIKVIMQDNEISFFDLVLIDGSAFTAEEELREVYGAKYIALDDINDIKNYNNYHALSNDSDYKLLKENKKLRNGYAIFERK